MAKTKASETYAQRVARHALSCSSCKPKVPRLMQTTAHLERMELICAIEWCEYRGQGRQAHA